MTRRLKPLPLICFSIAFTVALSVDWASVIWPEPVAAVEVAPVTIPPLRDEPVLEAGEVCKPAYYEISLSHELQDHTKEVCRGYGVPVELALAVMAVESGYREDAYYKSCYGLMQIHKVNHARLTDKLGLTDIRLPEDNITAGVYMLSELLYGHGDLHQALMAYNCGDAGAKRLWEQGIYNTKYSRTVVGVYEKVKGESINAAGLSTKDI